MRTSILSRSVIAVAALTVGSVALTATPATATASTVTRAEVLALAAVVRATPDPCMYGGGCSTSTIEALQTLAGQACSIEQSPGQYVYGVQAAATEPGQGADGLSVSANIYTEHGDGSRSFVHYCAFGAVASTAGSSTLSGSIQLGPQPPTALAGEVTVTPPILSTDIGAYPLLRTTGQSIQTIRTVTSKKVSTPKTSKQKKYAKKKYAKRVKAAQKSLTKALKKAGGSTSKRAAAKKVYSRQKTKAKKAYKKAVARYKVVKKSTTKTSSSPFDLTAFRAP